MGQIDLIETSDAIEDLRGLIRDCRDDREHIVLYSQLAFDVLLRKQARPPLLLEFLRDPLLDVPEAKNLSKFLEHASTNMLRPDVFPDVCTSVRQALVLGGLQQDDVPMVLRHLKTIAVRCCDGKVHSEALGSALLHAYQSVWDGIMNCRIRPDARVSPDILQLMVDSVSALWLNTQSAAFRLRIYQYASPHTSVAEYLVSLARGLPDDEALSMGRLHSDRELLIATLRSFRPEQLRSEIISATELLVEHETVQELEDPTWKSAVNSWLDCLQSFHATYEEQEGYMQNVYEVLAANVPPTAIAPHLRAMSEGEICRLLSSYWVPHHVPPQPDTGEDLRADRLREFSCEFARYLKEMPNFSNPFAQLIVTLARSNLPYTTMTTIVFDLVRTIHGAEKILPILFRLRKRGLIIDTTGAAAAVEELSATDPEKALYLFKCVPGLWLSRCPTLATNLIRTNTAMRYVIHAMMKCHDIQVRISDQQWRGGVRPPVPNLRVHLIHQIAYAFAYHTPGDARRAFRNVHYCYRGLVRSGAPLRPLMSKALVTAGVIRPLQDGENVPTARFRWILDVVREVEGEGVAELLDRMAWEWRRRNAVLKEERERLKRQGERDLWDKMKRRHEQMGWGPEAEEVLRHYSAEFAGVVRHVHVVEGKSPLRRRIVGPQTPRTRQKKFGPWDRSNE